MDLDLSKLSKEETIELLEKQKSIHEILRVTKDKQAFEKLEIPECIKEYLAKLIEEGILEDYDDMRNPSKLQDTAWNYAKSDYKTEEGLYYMFYQKNGDQVFVDNNNYTNIIYELSRQREKYQEE